MKKTEVKIYEDGSEFIDIFSEILKEDLDKSDLEDLIDKDFAATYKIKFPDNNIKELKDYHYLELLNGDIFLVSGEKSIFEWYLEWKKHI